MDETWEFYGPFAHLPGRLEWCRIHSPTHGSFDTCIVLGSSTAVPATVYVHDDAGQKFMEERYPECTTIRVIRDNLRMAASPDGRRLHCHLIARDGPLRQVEMSFVAGADTPRQVPYGGAGHPVWGGRWSCEGMDLELDADVQGIVGWADGEEVVSGQPAILTVGSCGIIRPL